MDTPINRYLHTLVWITISKMAISLMFLFISFATVSIKIGQGLPPVWLQYIKCAIDAYETSQSTLNSVDMHYRMIPRTLVVNENEQTSNLVYNPSLILWNPLRQYNAYCITLQCPNCQGQLKKWRWKDGSSVRDNPRKLVCLQNDVYLVSCVYLCDQLHHEIISHDPALLSSLRTRFPVIRIPFVLFHKSGVTRELYDFVSSSIQTGLQLMDIEKMITQLHNPRHYREDCEISALQTLPIHPSAREFSSFFPHTEGISRKLVFKIFLQSFLDVERMYIQHMASKKGKWISADHTFKVRYYYYS